MKISDVMTRDVKTVRPDQTAREAASFMLSADAGAIPVTDGDQLIGVQLAELAVDLRVARRPHRAERLGEPPAQVPSALGFLAEQSQQRVPQRHGDHPPVRGRHVCLDMSVTSCAQYDMFISTCSSRQVGLP